MLSDPRDPKRRQSKYTGGRNSESLDPRSTYGRPDLRFICETNTSVYPRNLSSDDVVMVPNFYNRIDVPEVWVGETWYDVLLKEIPKTCDECVSWHEGCHLLVKNPEKSPLFNQIVFDMCNYFDVDATKAAVRFNYYKDDTDWKSAHHDSAAFNPVRAKTQNITIGLSFGCTRELLFKHAQHGTSIYVPQPCGQLYSFGNSVNIRFLHGINAIEPSVRTGEGRISIIVWGFSRKVISEPFDPPILQNNDRRSICRDFQKGMCKYGDNCKWVHAKK